MSPEMVLKNDCIDIVCLGEGEDPIAEQAIAIVENKSYRKIQNLWVKDNGKIFKNPLRL